MLKNPLMEQLRAQLSSDDKEQMNESFAFADRIHFLLKKHNITQRQLAEKLGKKESEISKWLSGGHNFTIQTLIKISLAIGERIYNLPGINHQESAESQINIELRSSVIREFHPSMLIGSHTLQYKPFIFPEISELEVNSGGVICNTRTRQRAGDHFTQVHLKPEAFRHIEQAKIS
ncbi:helix-turn-helix domain-containing protein [Mucilaginibacter lappiensis]|uniref:Transcriptional regulator with XRE-family HTH domain n=1 Tax=Mucilaginibacter lappiensis TaxID=354630 RepID=A0A841JRK2_9SPHI|nr:helix-turn-helix transcriptional regulator [Mucilaginibacter lappiensis]MBB6130481.1 transcriptional regulator with XRE-family HTH domain [Mucilaginibacter lappiensis]